MLALGIAAASCGSDDPGTSAIGAGNEIAPLTSIAFCEEPKLSGLDRQAPLTDDEIAAQNAAADARFRIEAEFQSNSAWSGILYDRVGERLVVRVTAADADLKAQIAELTDLNVDIEIVTYSSQERQRAGDRLLDLLDPEQNPDSPMTGYGIEGFVPLVEISLSTLDNADTLAADWRIPPPLDIYCILPDADPQFGTLDEPDDS